MRNLGKTGLVTATLTMCFVTALCANARLRSGVPTGNNRSGDSWGDFCYDEKRWIFESENQGEADDARREHIQSTRHLISTYRCATWNEDCTKNLNP